ESQYLTLDLVIRANGIPTVGELQRSIGVLPAQMSRIIRSLETNFEKPLIHCQLNQADKRRIDVAITDEGRRLYNEFRAARLAKTREILQVFCVEARRKFVRICQRIREVHESGEHAKPNEK